jgi:hypothetical protein
MCVHVRMVQKYLFYVRKYKKYHLPSFRLNPTVPRRLFFAAQQRIAIT